VSGVAVIPTIDVLLPHRGTMLLLDRATDFDGDSLVAEYSPRPDAWYTDRSGNMPGWLGIELMAQTVAAHVALKKRLAGLPIKMGALLGTRCYEGRRLISGGFSVGQVLRIRVQETFRDDSGLAAYACSIGEGGRELATAILKVYEPDDFEAFIQGSAI